MRRSPRELAEWIFRYTTSEGNEVVYSRQMCKQPSRTKNWVELQMMLNDEEISSIEYERHEPNKLY
jgi:hypothetical protein